MRLPRERVAQMRYLGFSSIPPRAIFAHPRALCTAAVQVFGKRERGRGRKQFRHNARDTFVYLFTAPRRFEKSRFSIVMGRGREGGMQDAF